MGSDSFKELLGLITPHLNRFKEDKRLFAEIDSFVRDNDEHDKKIVDLYLLLSNTEKEEIRKLVNIFCDAVDQTASHSINSKSTSLNIKASDVRKNDYPLHPGCLKCNIPLGGGQVKEVNIPIQAPKIERENAWAMTQGFKKDDGKLYYSSIFTSHKNAVIKKNGFAKVGGFAPQLLSYKTSVEKQYPVSNVGHSMGVSDYKDKFSLPHKYVAILDTVFLINQEFYRDRDKLLMLWQKFCTNGIFDQWEPIAPYHMLTGDYDRENGKKVIKDPQILLLRIFELDCNLEVEHQQTYTDRIHSNGVVNLKQPIIPYDRNDSFSHNFQGAYYFEDIKNIVLTTMKEIGALQKELIVNNTSEIEIVS